MRFFLAGWSLFVVFTTDAVAIPDPGCYQLNPRCVSIPSVPGGVRCPQGESTWMKRSDPASHCGFEGEGENRRGRFVSAKGQIDLESNGSQCGKLKTDKYDAEISFEGQLRSSQSYSLKVWVNEEEIILAQFRINDHNEVLPFLNDLPVLGKVESTTYDRISLAYDTKGAGAGDEVTFSVEHPAESDTVRTELSIFYVDRHCFITGRGRMNVTAPGTTEK